MPDARWNATDMGKIMGEVALIIAVFGTSGLLETDARAQSGEVIRTTLCDIAVDPERFYGKTVGIRASFFSEPHHGFAGLLNSECPEQQLNYSYSERDPHMSPFDGTAEYVEHWLLHGSFGQATIMLCIEATFTGTIVEQYQNRFDVFVVSSVSDIEFEDHAFDPEWLDQGLRCYDWQIMR